MQFRELKKNLNSVNDELRGIVDLTEWVAVHHQPALLTTRLKVKIVIDSISTKHEMNKEHVVKRLIYRLLQIQRELEEMLTREKRKASFSDDQKGKEEAAPIPEGFGGSIDYIHSTDSTDSTVFEVFYKGEIHEALMDIHGSVWDDSVMVFMEGCVESVAVKQKYVRPKVKPEGYETLPEVGYYEFPQKIVTPEGVRYA